MLTNWLGNKGRLRTLEVSYRGLDFPGRPYRCRGVIKQRADSLVTLEVWCEDADGQRTTVGTATVELEEGIVK